MCTLLKYGSLSSTIKDFIPHRIVRENGYTCTVYPKKYAQGFSFVVLCCGYTLTDFPISIRLTSLALWQSNDCPSASKATLMNMDKYLMWIHYERLHNHNKAKHNKTVCIFLGIYCSGYVMDDSDISDTWKRDSDIWRLNECEASHILLERVTIYYMQLSFITHFTYWMQVINIVWYHVFIHIYDYVTFHIRAIFAAVIHWWRSPLDQFARAMTTDEYDGTIPVSHVRVMSQINCDDATMLRQKRPSTMTKWAVDDKF